MTISSPGSSQGPALVAPVPGVASDPGYGTESAKDEEFAALIAAELGGPAATAPDATAPVTTAAAVAAPASKALPETTPDPAPEDPSELGDQLGDRPTPGSAAGLSPLSLPTLAPSSLIVSAPATPPGPAGQDSRLQVSTPPVSPPSVPTPQVAAGQPGDEPLPVTAVVADTPSATDPTDASSPTPTRAAEAQQVAPQAPQVPVGPGTGVATLASAPALDSASAAVTTQVFPEVTRLATGPDGVHRVTLQLNPGALGEVRVVLTIRGGEVRVRLAGGEEAVAALQSSSQELHRMLERAGVQTSRIDVRDLAGSPVAPAREPQPARNEQVAGNEQQGGPGTRHEGDHGRHDRSQLWGQAREGSPDTGLHHPWTGGGRIATDGADQTARRASGPGVGRPFDPVRAYGVDLTM